MTRMALHQPLEPVDLLTLEDVLDASVERVFVPIRRRRNVARPHRLADLITTVHAANHARSPVILDLSVLLAVSFTVLAGPLWWQLVFAPLAVSLAYIAQVYSDRDTVQTRGVLWYLSGVCAPLAITGTIAVTFGVLPVAAATGLVVVSLGALTLSRGLTWTALTVLRRRGHGLRHTLIIGDSDASATLWRRLVEFPEAGLVPIQLLGWEAAHEVGTVDREIRQHGIQHVVLVAPGPEDALLTAALPRHEDDAPYFSTVPAIAELYLDPHSLTEVGGIPLIPHGRVTHARRTFSGKRVIDALLSGIGLVLLLPVMAAIALTIKLDDGGPVFYSQQRVGREGRMFPMRKFRSMVVDADAELASLIAHNESDGLLFKMKSDPRITRVGRLIRKTSLDELPQLWNVLVGQMSAVGPRPLPVDPGQFTPVEAERHSVLPGITGYWQLSGGPELTYDEMVRLDLAYIRNWSVWLDLRLLLRTVPALLHRHGAS
ncbi:MAG: putative glycosyltransferase [Frankiales bacterium]|nr:putative glycosyltransferase [Frankiales bacterium]